MCRVIGYYSRGAARAELPAAPRGAHSPQSPSRVDITCRPPTPRRRTTSRTPGSRPRCRGSRSSTSSRRRRCGTSRPRTSTGKLLAEGLDIGLATVYRVLTQFEQAGLLVRHHFDSGKAVFELNEGHHHDHLVCLQLRPRRGVLRRRHRKAAERRRARARLRDLRARALSLRRLREAALPVPQDGRRPTDAGRSGVAFGHRSRRSPRRRPATSRRLKSARRNPSSHKRAEIGGRARGAHAGQAADLLPQRRREPERRRAAEPEQHRGEHEQRDRRASPRSAASPRRGM